MFIIIIVVILILIISRYIVLRQSKPSHHWKEFVRPQFYIKFYTFPLPFIIPRALVSDINFFFRYKYIGIAFEVSHVILYNSKLEVFVGIRSLKKTLQNGYTHDLGVSGMIPHHKTGQETIKFELQEEVTIEDENQSKIIFKGTLFPEDDCDFIVHMFMLKVENIHVKNSDTFSDFQWIRHDKLKYFISCNKTKYKVFSRGVTNAIQSGLIQRMINVHVFFS